MKNLFIYAVLCILFLQCDKSATSSTSNSSVSMSSTGQGGSMARYAIVGNYLYTVDNTSLKVFDITDGANPVLKNTVTIGFQIETIFPFKDKLFMGSTSQVYIYSITNPAEPTQLGIAISPQVLRRCDPVVAKDTVAFATLRTNGACGGTSSILAVYDIKNINNPTQKAFLNVPEPYGLGYSDSILYICNGKYGLSVINIAHPYQPVSLKVINSSSSFIDVIPYNNILICWVSDGIILYDISTSSNPVFISKIS